MRIVALAIAFGVCSCAAFNGQSRFEGPEGNFPTVSTTTLRQPEPGQFGGMWTTHTTHLLNVNNPSTQPWVVDVDCSGYTLFTDVTVPPRTTQSFLLGREDQTCTVRWRP